MANPNPLDHQNATARSSAKLTDAEKSLLTLRQAHDKAVDHARQLTGKLETAEELIQDLRDERNSADEAREVAECVEKASRQEREDLRRKCGDLQKRLTELTAQHAAAVEAENRAATDRDYFRQQYDAIRFERDRLHEIFEKARLSPGCEADLAREVEEVRTKSDELQHEAEQAKARHQKIADDLTAQIAYATSARDSAVANVIRSQAEAKALRKEIAMLRKDFDDERTVMQAQIVALRSIGMPG
jgi:chromosome segregation ATPase